MYIRIMGLIEVKKKLSWIVFEPITNGLGILHAFHKVTKEFIEYLRMDLNVEGCGGVIWGSANHFNGGKLNFVE